MGGNKKEKFINPGQDIFSLNKSDLEEVLDHAKTRLLVALVSEGALTLDMAEEWAATHTIVLRKKGFFRTLTDRWVNTEDVEGNIMLVVNNPLLKVNLPPIDGNDNKLASILAKVREDHGLEEEDK